LANSSSASFNNNQSPRKRRSYSSCEPIQNQKVGLRCCAAQIKMGGAAATALPEQSAGTAARKELINHKIHLYANFTNLR
jgi:hypothetical protein